MKYVVSVSKTYKHRGKHKHRKSTKKFWYIYYYDENLQFHSEQVSYLKAMYFKQNLWAKRNFFCEECLNLFEAIVKKRAKTTECPFCENQNQK